MPNDIKMGVDGSMNQLILNGINGSGKSVLLKSVALLIIMA